MTRTLLERAAKAAGLKLTWGEVYMIGGDEVDCSDLPYVVSDDREEAPAYWNPLEDDGDALRLAVKLRLEVTYYCRFGDDAEVADCRCELEPTGADPYAATRLCIVRAAASMVKE